jgi:geranylgeranyl reductase family protein
VYDLIVIGAGPAGSFAAFKSASRGLRTLLIEKERLPRHKPCGGVVHERTLSKLDGHIYDHLEAKSGFNNIFYNYRGIRTLEGEEYFFKRDRFDYFITKMAMDAGAEVVDSCAAVEVVNRSNEVIVRTPHLEYKARTLIGADGVHSIVGKTLGLVHDFRKKYAAVVADIEVGSVGGLLGTGDHSNTYFFDNLIGFAWLIPNKKSVNIGMGALMRKSAGLRRKFESFCGKLGIPCPQVDGHMIPYSVLEKIQDGRVMLVGDAAGFVNAWTGGGIGHGIFSAEKAVETCSEMIENDDFSEKMSQRYPQGCRTEMRNLRFRSKLIEILDQNTPSSFELPGIAESFVKRLSAIASLSL